MYADIAKILLLCTVLHFAKSHSTESCPDQTNTGTEVYNLYVKGGLNENIHVTAPSQGVFPKKINCIHVTDLESSSAEPVIGPGGVGFNYVEVTIKPGFMESLYYHIEVYIEQ